MNELMTLYPYAVEQVKNYIYEDMDHYLGNKEIKPSYEQFRMDRKHYLEQIWLNVWLNLTVNRIPKTEKKSYLISVGYDMEDVGRKLLNHLFRNEMRTFQPFDAMSWADAAFANHPKKWEEHYQQARISFLEQEKKKQLIEQREHAKNSVLQAALHILKQDYAVIYVHVRYYIACQLTNDVKIIEKRMKKRKTNQETDSFQTKTISALFHEQRDANYNRTIYPIHDYEYERLITYYLSEHIPALLMKQFTREILSSYHEIYGSLLTESKLKDIIIEPFFELIHEYFEAIQKEYLSDLLLLAHIPFEEERHIAIYEEDMAKHQRRKEEVLAEIERKKQEEAQMLEDLFGQEYSPSVEQNIQYVLHIGETNTGKTHQALQRMKEAKNGLYLAPLRLLALEVYDKLNGDGIPCSLKTGEEEKVTEGANHISCTVEMFKETDVYEIVVIDEAQMIADKDRGFAWYKAITKANAKEVHIIGSRSMKNMMLQLLAHCKIKIYEYSRDIPLEVEAETFRLAHTQKGDALVCFSRRRVLEVAATLNHATSMIYGSMPPETRKKQMQRFIEGETSVIVSTDAIGMGLNLPIRRIVFLENEKFDGEKRRKLTSQEIKQIAGRAGRKTIYNVGKVAFTTELDSMAHLLQQKDESISTFTIAPTNEVLGRFQKYSRPLAVFFELWDKFESPKGTKKATLSAERELYDTIRYSGIEDRLSIERLYGFLHLPFSTNEPSLVKQWRDTLFAIVYKKELPEPPIKKETLEELELAYKAAGLHLLFLYRIGQRNKVSYWEKMREEISDAIHEMLKTGMTGIENTCKVCETKLPWAFPYPLCNDCYSARQTKKRQVYESRNN
ncbi:helicase-related protein [Bacillus sp. 165]|uniref:helicase-related protein n=1 Tax=Bacillus sp. 165 TaxID=1529117 RepID=UPI001ADD20D2|nr:helicase-related protein [Bacillus sp. 165]MBO9129259.1 RNA helicase [Bacillus sp. 165]